MLTKGDMEMNRKILAVIPARGGSKGIPRKNVKLLGKHPLIYYAINSAQNSKYVTDVVVTTDSDEILSVAEHLGVDTLLREESLAQDNITLDPVVYDAYVRMERKFHKKYDVVITLQPTSPLLKSETLDLAIESFLQKQLDTMISVKEQRCLSWSQCNGRFVPNYQERVNRQQLPANYVETGGIFITKADCVKQHTRIGEHMSVFVLNDIEGIDIDDYSDWWIADKYLKQKNIFIRVDGYRKIGLGHIYRGLTLANLFAEHNVVFVLKECSDIGINKIRESNYKYIIIQQNEDILDLIDEYKVDLVINDILNTEITYMKKLKEKCEKVINFEDLGEGRFLADMVFNDIYSQKNELVNHYYGSEYYCLREEFILAEPKAMCEEVKNILILFGGTDPCDITQRILKIICNEEVYRGIKFTFILGLGYPHSEEIQKFLLNNKCTSDIEVLVDVKNISKYMEKADLAISSQGRTMYELAYMQVPTVLIAQNKRERRHSFGSLENGFVNLGINDELEDITIYSTLSWLITCQQIRQQMKDCMKKKSQELSNGMYKVKGLIFNEIMK